MPARIPTPDLLADLRRVADDLGHPPTTTDYDEHGEYSRTTVQSRFDGPWADIVAEAGLDAPQTPHARGGIEVQCPNCGSVKQYAGDRDRYQCAGCSTTVPLWRGRLEVSADNDLLRSLAEGPKPADELPRRPHRSERAVVDRLKAPASAKTSKSRGRTTTVYYLYGDERAAIDRFIDLNRSYVAGCLEDGSNPLRRGWDETRYQMLVEQWRWTRSSEVERGRSQQA